MTDWLPGCFSPAGCWPKLKLESGEACDYPPLPPALLLGLEMVTATKKRVGAGHGGYSVPSRVIQLWHQCIYFDTHSIYSEKRHSFYSSTFLRKGLLRTEIEERQPWRDYIWRHKLDWRQLPWHFFWIYFSISSCSCSVWWFLIGWQCWNIKCRDKFFFKSWIGLVNVVQLW